MPDGNTAPGGPLGLGILPAAGRALENMLKALPGAIASEIAPPPQQTPTYDVPPGAETSSSTGTSWIPLGLVGGAILLAVLLATR